MTESKKNATTTTNPMEVELTEEDFLSYLNKAKDQKQISIEEAEVTAGAIETVKGWFGKGENKKVIQESSEMEQLRELLPKVVADKIARRVPSGFDLSEIKFIGEVSGQPFGIGVSGSIEVLFKKG